MPINPYFSDYSGEQDLEEEINIELIQKMGRDVYYIPKTADNIDKLFGEDNSLAFNSQFAIEAYIDMPEGPEGTDIVSSFSTQIKQSIKIRIARKRFNELIGASTNLARPMEGDLIFLPLTKTLYEINFVQHLNPFYPLGRNWCYVLNLEVFTYSHEKINTGNVDIDQVYEQGAKPVTNFQISTGTGTFYAGQIVYQFNGGITMFTGNVLYWNPDSSLLQVNSITGAPSTSYAIVGMTTEYYPNQPNYTVSLVNNSFVKLPTGQDINVPVGDNDAIEEERFEDNVLPYDEQNPFSEEDN